MTQLYQRNLARHVRLARQDGKQGGNGNRSDNAGGVTPTPPSTPANTGMTFGLLPGGTLMPLSFLASNGNRGGGLDSLAVDPVSTASSPTTTGMHYSLGCLSCCSCLH